MKKLSIIIPVYNEKDNLLKILEKVRASKISLEKEIIIVDDFSEDGTREIIKKIKNKKIIKVFHDKNSGKGASVKSGLKHVTGDIVIIQDADLEYDPKDYVKLIEPITSKKVKVVYGSRILKKNYKYAHYSYILGGRLVTLFTNILFFSKLTDEPTCYKVFDAKTIKEINIKSHRFDWEPEVTAKILKKGINIHEVPISYYPRSKKEGKKIRLKDGIHAIWALFKYRIID